MSHSTTRGPTQYLVRPPRRNFPKPRSKRRTHPRFPGLAAKIQSKIPTAPPSRRQNLCGEPFGIGIAKAPGAIKKSRIACAKPGLPAVRGGYASRPPSRIFRSEIKRRQIFVENAFHRQTPPPPRRRRRTIRVFGYSAEFSAGTGPFSARTRAISRLPIERSSASLAFAPALGEVLPSSQ